MVRGTIRKKELEESQRKARQAKKNTPKNSAMRSCMGVLVFLTLFVCIFGCGALFFVGDQVAGWLAKTLIEQGHINSFVLLHKDRGKILAVEGFRKTMEGHNSAKPGFEVAACWLSVFDLESGERLSRTELPDESMCAGNGVQLLAGGDTDQVWALANNTRPFGIRTQDGQIDFTTEDIETKNPWLKNKLSGGVTRNLVDPDDPNILWNKVDYIGTVRIHAKTQKARRDPAGEELFRAHIKLCGTDHRCAYESGHGKDWARAGDSVGRFSGVAEGADGRLLDTNTSARVLGLRGDRDDVLVRIGKPKSGDITLEAVSRDEKRSRWKKSARALLGVKGTLEVDGASSYKHYLVLMLSGYLVVLDERTGSVKWSRGPDIDMRPGSS